MSRMSRMSGMSGMSSMTSMGDNRQPQSRLRKKYMSAINEAEIMNKDVKLEEEKYGFQGREGIEYREIQERERINTEKARLENKLLTIEKEIETLNVDLSVLEDLILEADTNIDGVNADIDRALHAELPIEKDFLRMKKNAQENNRILTKKEIETYNGRIEKEKEKINNKNFKLKEMLTQFKNNKIYLQRKVSEKKKGIADLIKGYNELNNKLTSYYGGFKRKVVKRKIIPVKAKAKPTARKPAKPTARKPTKPTRPVVRRQKPTIVRRK